MSGPLPKPPASQEECVLRHKIQTAMRHLAKAQAEPNVGSAKLLVASARSALDE